jgi:excisionase family DNA binding protein
MSKENPQTRTGNADWSGSAGAGTDFESLNQKKVFTVCEAAQYLAIHKDTLYDMLHAPDGSDNDFPHFHIGKGDRSIRVFRELLDLWVIGNNKGISNQELIAFRKAYIHNMGRNVIEPQSQEAIHG